MQLGNLEPVSYRQGSTTVSKIMQGGIEVWPNIVKPRLELEFLSGAHATVNIDGDFEWSNDAGATWTTVTASAASTIAGTGDIIMKSANVITKCIFADVADSLNGYFRFESAQDLKDCYNMFFGADITSVEINCPLPAVWRMFQMFGNCGSLLTIDFVDLFTPLLSDTGYMFYFSRNITTINITNWDHQITNVDQMFMNCHSLIDLTLSNTTFPLIDSAVSLFKDCRAAINVDVSPFNFSLIDNFDEMFRNCWELGSITGKLNSSIGTTFKNTFNNCPKLVCISGIDTTNQTDTTDMFLGTALLTAPDAADQATIEAGSNWDNPGTCP